MIIKLFKEKKNGRYRNIAEVARDAKVSRPTVYKYLKEHYGEDEFKRIRRERVIEQFKEENQDKLREILNAL